MLEGKDKLGIPFISPLLLIIFLYCCLGGPTLDSSDSAWLCSVPELSCFSVTGLPAFLTEITWKVEAFSNGPLTCKNSSDPSAELCDTYRVNLGLLKAKICSSALV